MRRGQYAAVITVGAGDKMFWGRLAARLARVPVIASALHSTGWPDGVGRLNRMLTSITDAFIAVAKPHGEFLVDYERFPAKAVHVIPNGVDTDRFVPAPDALGVRSEIGADYTTPLVGILAALRPEKNHELFLQAAEKILKQIPKAKFVVIGDGPRRADLEQLANELGVDSSVHFLGNRSDIPQVLASLNVLALTSHNEANPVSILEGMSCGLPIVTTDVGSVRESVIHNQTGWVVPAGDLEALSESLVDLLLDPDKAHAWGLAGRQRVLEQASLDVMVQGYEKLISGLYDQKTS